MNDLLKGSIQFVDESFGGKKYHFERTLFWLLQLRPDADLALRIAAYGHDVERAFKPVGSKRFLTYENDQDLAEHQEKSAKIMSDFLILSGADQELAERVKCLIEKHEEGGDDDQNLLKDADSISYFETNAKKHVKEMRAGTFSPQETKEKFEYMLSRITAEEAKEIASPMYHGSISLLDK